jgi:acetyl-CoA decarbonylase/synthase complex subunit delta
VDFVALCLDSADPNGDNKSIEECVALCKAVAEAVDIPLVVQGSKNVEKDGQLLPKVAEALSGKEALLLSAKEDNYKTIAVAGVLAYNQKIAAESAVDINLAKQLNIVIAQQGVKAESIAMHAGTAAAGYGFEYVVSTLDRIKAAALGQNDKDLQMPIITPVAAEAWGVKESVVSPEDAPTPDWGPAEERGINMEISTASAAIAAGTNAVILRHPASVAAVSKLVAALA